MARYPISLVPIRIVNGLPFVEVTISSGNKSVALQNVLLDSGSAGSLFSADRMLDIGLTPQPEDGLRVIRGVGGTEYVYTKGLSSLSIGNTTLRSFTVEVGAMNYGFEIDGLLGTDYLRKAGLLLDFYKLGVKPAAI